MSAREFTQWEAFYLLEPFGDDRADLRNAILCSTIFNLLKGKKVTAKTPQEFMPFLKKKKPFLHEEIVSVMSLFPQS